MEHLLNSQGSCWKKWDLHIHTPESVLNNNFSGDWNRYIEVLEKLEDISVIGITDYFSVKGYKKVKKFKEEGNLKNIDLILPNIELRLNTTTYKNRAINIHFIFSPEVDNLIEKYFLNELEFEYNQNHYKCTEDDLISLGEIFCNGEYSREKALYEGMKQFKVSLDTLKKVLQKHKQRFKDKYIIVIPNSNVDGNSGNQEDAFKATRRELYHFSHAIFSGNESDRSFFLGEKNYEETIKQCGKIMPCLHGSDAHDFNKVGKPDKNRFTWIKAEPVFEGLLQVLYEPKGRVVIQEDHPDKKNDYDVITSIKFKDSKDFTEREIKLNSGLNTIIGGKSSGKSLLLYKIAQAISKEEILLRENDAVDGKTLWSNPYKDTFIENVNFEVTWRNGKVISILEAHLNGQITYIPQMYINALSEDTANSVLQKKIREIILQDDESKEFWQAKGTEGVKLKHELSNQIIELFEELEKQELIINDLKKYGDREAIEKEKQKLLDQLQIKIITANLTKADEKLIEKNEELKKDIHIRIKDMKNNKEKDNKLSKELSDLFELFNMKLKDIKQEHSGHLDILDELHLSINTAFIHVQNKIEKNVKVTNTNLDFENKKLQGIEEILAPLLEKMKGNAAIQTLKSKINEQDEYLLRIENLNKEKLELEKKVTLIQEKVIEIFEEMLNLKKNINEYFNAKTYFNDLRLKTYIGFDQISFNQNFMSIFVRRGKLTNLFPNFEVMDIFDQNDEFIFDEENFVSKIKFLFKTVLFLDSSKFKKGYTKQKAVEGLLSSNYTNVIFDLEKDGDILSEMSPGKRGLVLIGLFLDMSHETHPILIDQPEDNLDNRTISTDLVKFIKEKSQRRQIVIVTHNANLVVLTDSENVIVANQDKLLKENDSSRFEYINGALECDFNINQKISGRGIKSHVCEILEGGKDAFEKREKKYGF